MPDVPSKTYRIVSLHHLLLELEEAIPARQLGHL